MSNVNFFHAQKVPLMCERCVFAAARGKIINHMIAERGRDFSLTPRCHHVSAFNNPHTKRLERKKDTGYSAARLKLFTQAGNS